MLYTRSKKTNQDFIIQYQIWNRKLRQGDPSTVPLTNPYGIHSTSRSLLQTPPNRSVSSHPSKDKGLKRRSTISNLSDFIQ